MSVPMSQAAPGTYGFALSASDIVLFAFSMCNIRGTQLTQQHLVDAAIASNLAMADLTNSLPMRFALETQAITPLVQGTATYALSTRTVAVPIVTLAVTSGGSVIERVLGPISAYEYRAMPTKSQQGPPTAYWFSLTAAPSLTLWPTPDGSSTYTLYAQSLRQLGDVDLTNSQGVDSPYRFLDALTTNIAGRLAENYAPAKADRFYALAEKRLSKAIGRDIEDVPISILPALGSYYQVY